jgi:hypothetical protein
MLGIVLLNALGVGRNENLVNASFVFTGAALYPIGGWLMCLYLGWKDATSHHLQLLLNAVGLPGTLLVLLLAVSK